MQESAASVGLVFDDEEPEGLRGRSLPLAAEEAVERIGVRGGRGAVRRGDGGGGR